MKKTSGRLQSHVTASLPCTYSLILVLMTLRKIRLRPCRVNSWAAMESETSVSAAAELELRVLVIDGCSCQLRLLHVVSTFRLACRAALRLTEQEAAGHE